MEWVGEAEEMVSGDNFIACGSTKKDHALDFKWMRAQTLDANAFHSVCSVFFWIYLEAVSPRPRRPKNLF